jgi:protein-L-isoaspartate(D-aspartate) O-methyltransferase
MKDYATARERMVQRQLRARGIADPRVLDAMRRVPRHAFMDESLYKEAYDDNPLPIGEGQTISQPYMVAVMTELLETNPQARILEIGTGSGYQAAVLSVLCRWVFSVERIPRLAERARETLHKCGYDNVTIVVADGTRGRPEHAPYDGIIVTAGSPGVPDVLVDQLIEGGRLVIPVGDRFSQTLKRVVKTKRGTRIEDHTGCRFVDLIGEFGWSDT